MNVNEELQKIYNDVSEWDRFAETKHAATFAVWTAALFALLSSEFFLELEVYERAISVLVVFVGISINVLAFMPFINRLRFFKDICWKKYHKIPTNCLFYQSIFISAYEIKKTEIDIEAQMMNYKTVIESRFGQTINGKLTEDYLRQIIAVATVATIKLYLFSLEVRYIFMVLMMTGVLIIIA